MRAIATSFEQSLAAIASILLIVAAGGGFKQTLIDAGVGAMIGDAAKDSSLSPLILGWLVAVGIRLATGSARTTSSCVPVPRRARRFVSSSRSSG